MLAAEHQDVGRLLAMDSKDVSAELRKEIRPLLKDRGFQKFTSRYAWRVHDDRVDVVNFQSFNDYKARSLGCTTYSFAVNLGCYFTQNRWWIRLPDGRCVRGAPAPGIRVSVPRKGYQDFRAD
jgi:hypothetical protein